MSDPSDFSNLNKRHLNRAEQSFIVADYDLILRSGFVQHTELMFSYQ